MAKNEKKMEKVVGTNCYNCKFVALQDKAVDTKDLNEEGGIDPKNKDDLERAKKADLITLPGGSKVDASTKRFCNNEQIKTYVTVRMCCAYWDNAGVKRPWKSK
jgi:hypothetical protein